MDVLGSHARTAFDKQRSARSQSLAALSAEHQSNLLRAPRDPLSEQEHQQPEINKASFGGDIQGHTRRWSHWHMHQQRWYQKPGASCLQLTLVSRYINPYR